MLSPSDQTTIASYIPPIISCIPPVYNPPPVQLTPYIINPSTSQWR